MSVVAKSNDGLLHGLTEPQPRESWYPMVRWLFCFVALFSWSVAHAAELDGVLMPDTQMVNGTRLLLNGIGLRTYSVFYIHIYVAGLYLVHRSDDPDSILQSSDYKLLYIRFLRDVSAEEARTAWRDGFEQNCKSPCKLASMPVHEFLAAVQPIHKGDEAALIFTPAGVTVSLNHQAIGRINDPNFAELILATFIGQVPPTPRLKRELLGSRR